MKKLGWSVATLTLVPLIIIAVAASLSGIASCSYDDLPNVWSCGQAWAIPLMYNLDPIIFLVAYPTLGVGFLLGLIWVCIKGFLIFKEHSNVHLVQ